MKTINVSFEDKEMEAIEKAKKKQLWRAFILERAVIDSSNEIHNKGINADALRGLCLEYDLKSHAFPESRYEGFSILCFFLEEEIKIGLHEDEEEWDKRLMELQEIKDKEGKE